MAKDHSLHGLEDGHGVPLDPDCPCRGTADQDECADDGCGFCRAMATMPHLYARAEGESLEPAEEGKDLAKAWQGIGLLLAVALIGYLSRALQ